MLSEDEFKDRYIRHMVWAIVGKDSTNFYSEIAESAYEMYEEDPGDMTPEEHAEEEIAEWRR